MVRWLASLLRWVRLIPAPYVAAGVLALIVGSSILLVWAPWSPSGTTITQETANEDLTGAGDPATTGAATPGETTSEAEFTATAGTTTPPGTDRTTTSEIGSATTGEPGQPTTTTPGTTQPPTTPPPTPTTPPPTPTTLPPIPTTPPPTPTTPPPTPTTLPPVQTWNVSIDDFAFQPGTITINAGDRVRWTNNETQASHTSTSTSTETWDSGTLTPGSPPFTSDPFNTPGTFNYFCAIHPLTMSGSVVVNP